MSPSLFRTVSSAWRCALLGTLVSLPISVLMDWLPNAEASTGGGIIVIGAFVAGVIAVVRSTDPNTAGFRAGFLGGAIGFLELIVAVVSPADESTVMATPSPSVMVSVAMFSVLLFVLSPLFGSVCGRVGGWVATTVATRWTATPS